jgi:hypothetical protein
MDSMHGAGATANSDALNSLMGKPIPNIELKDKEGKIIFRGVKTHPEDKFKFDIGSKVNGKIVKGCVITTP